MDTKNEFTIDALIGQAPLQIENKNSLELTAQWAAIFLDNDVIPLVDELLAKPATEQQLVTQELKAIADQVKKLCQAIGIHQSSIENFRSELLSTVGEHARKTLRDQKNIDTNAVSACLSQLIRVRSYLAGVVQSQVKATDITIAQTSLPTKVTANTKPPAKSESAAAAQQGLNRLVGSERTKTATNMDAEMERIRENIKKRQENEPVPQKKSLLERLQFWKKK